MKDYKKASAIIIVISIAVFCAILVLTAALKGNDQTVTDYTLKSYKNTVALYKGENLVKTYDEIVLDTLPIDDINRFKEGIKIKCEDDAAKILEDYDS